MMNKKKILFITGTRADYGKIKSLLQRIDSSSEFDLTVYVTGMHLSSSHGSTYLEVLKDGWRRIYVDYASSGSFQNMSGYLGTLIKNLSAFLVLNHQDLIVVHGDRCEAMAGALSGVLNNIRVGHIEGGELSGTIDESLRHAITKLAHEHFVSNQDAAERVWAMGEEESHIYKIGSPDIDLMMGRLTDVDVVKKYYGIPFDNYSIAMLHPVTTEPSFYQQASVFVSSLIESKKNYVVIYPNNDRGFSDILACYKRFEGLSNFKVFPSIRFEYFLSLLKNSDFLIGNSSAGVREAGVYGVPAIDIGNRQSGRYELKLLPHLQHCEFEVSAILSAISSVKRGMVSQDAWGDGHAADYFMDVLKRENFWTSSIQKRNRF